MTQPPKDPANAGESDELDEIFVRFFQELRSLPNFRLTPLEDVQLAWSMAERAKAAIQAQLDAAHKSGYQDGVLVGEANLGEAFGQFSQTHVDEAVRSVESRIESAIGKDATLQDIYGDDPRNNYGYQETQVRDAARWLQRRLRQRWVTTQSKSKENE